MAVIVTSANIHDSRVAIRLVDSIPPIRSGRGRPRRRPISVKGDTTLRSLGEG